ncbi:hypothetical protein BSYN_11980 [Bacteroides sedimenti]|uniref:Uncharacterized protein n=2 Tax=Bacteroides sedimenti TaxID=2136147 RepID=A0ABM8IG94_9BACE
MDLVSLSVINNEIMFEQTFKNIDDILYKDSGANSELDYIGQTSWVLFLRYPDGLEQDKVDSERRWIIDIADIDTKTSFKI